MKKIIYTSNSLSLFIVRIVLGAVMLPHGMQKVMAFESTMNMFTSKGMPSVIALLVIAAEFLGSIGLIVGCLSRVAALGIACVMCGAIAMVHYQMGFFMNWMGTQKGEGYEYHLLVIAMAFAIILEGAGRWSVDRCLTEKCADKD